MFFVKKLRHDILLDPSCLGPNMVKLIRDRIFAELEGTCLGKYGYVIMVHNSNYFYFAVAYQLFLLCVRFMI